MDTDRSTNPHQFLLPLLFLSMLLLITGCGAQSVKGGTPGELRVAGQPLSDVQITVHQAEGAGYRPVGFGVSTDNGSFALFSNGAQGPLLLSPGEFRCTLESAGAPVQIPTAFRQPETTPLKFSWKAEDSQVLLEVSTAFAPVR